jgi:hypothetical protein
VSTETPSTLLWTQPSSRGGTEPCELTVCLLPAAYSHRRADPPSSKSRPSSRAGRFAGAAAVIAVRAPLPCDRAVPLFRRVSPSSSLPLAPTRLSTHRQAKALPFFG